MLAYYGSKLSDHMTETDEGFLICQSVPIARTGYYEYLPREIGREGEAPVRVFRSESEVFDPAAMASFEGKPVTLGHPPVSVTPENAASYISGHVQNVHRGKGEDADLLLADLFITDAELIRRIKDGLREVSCGYECKYTDSEGEGAQQRHIRGNHVAVVEAGRARETETSVPAVGNIQPASPKQLSQLPEGDRESGTIVIRTTACVRNTDTIRWQGASWRVTSVLHWNPHGYYEVYAARL